MSAMIRLWPSLGVGCLLLIGSFGCTGQNVEGAWRGAFPLEDAKDCRIRLTFDRRFDLACRTDSGWLAAGRYSREGDGLVFHFESLARRGEAIRDLPLPIRMRMEGKGNTICLTQAPGLPEECWTRIMH